MTTIAFVIRSLALPAAALVTVGLARRQSAAARALVLTAALAGLVVLPAVAAAMPSWHVTLPAWLSAAPSALGAHASAPRASAPATSSSVFAEAPRASATTLAPHTSSAATSSASAPVFSPPATLQSASAPPAPFSWPSLAFAAWLGVTILLLVRIARDYARMARWSAATSPVDDPSWRSVVDRVRAELGISRAIDIRSSGDTRVPLVAGVVKPTLVLPATATQWSDDVRLDVVRHELAHVARQDAAAQFTCAIACALHWFNPLAWTAARAAAALRERACDDVVIAAGTRPSTYADRLIDLAGRAAGFRPQPAALAMAGSSRLRDRITSLLDDNARRGALTPRLTALVAAMAAIGVAAVGAIEPVAASTSRSTTSSWAAALSTTSAPAGQNRSNASTPQTSKNTSAARAQTPGLPGICSGSVEDSDSSNGNDDLDRHWTVRLRGADCSLDLHAVGRVTYNDDFTDVAGLSSGGYFSLDATTGSHRRQLDIRVAGGQLTHDYREDGRSHAWDADAQRWFASFLVALDRRTAVGVDVRLPHLLKQGGIGAVLDETAQMTDYPRTVYVKKLMQARTLSADERRRVLDQAAALMTSDYYGTEVLKLVIGQGQLTDARERASVVSMIEHMASDYYRTEAMKAIGSRTLSPDQLSALLDVTAHMREDYYKYEMLKFLIDGADVSNAQRTTVIDAVGSITSDYYASEALKLAMSRGLVSAGDAGVLTTAIGRMRDDNYIAGALGLLLTSRAPEDVVVQTTLDASARIRSAYYRSVVLNKLVSGRRLSEDRLLRVLDLARAGREDYYAAETMVKALGNGGVTERVRAAARTAAASMSRYYGDEVRRAADRGGE